MRPLVLLVCALSFPVLLKAQGPFRQTASGLEFHFFVDEPGATGKVGDFTSLHMIMKTENGKELRNSYRQKGGKPILFPIKHSAFDGDIYEAVSLMSVGDSAEFKIASDSMYYKIFKQPLPQDVKTGSFLHFIIAVKNIQSQETRYNDLTKKYESELKEKHDEIEEQKKIQDAQIQQYLSNMGMTDEIVKKDEGMYLNVLQEGEGETLRKGQTVIIDYIAKLLDGTEIESSYKTLHPISFKIGNGDVLKAWDLGLAYFKLGMSAQLIVPSHMAYGHRGKEGIIPPYAPICFDIKVIRVVD